MVIIQTILIAVSLGFDAFSVALSIGNKIKNPDQVFRLSWHFGIFQFIMPIIGWHLGHDLSLVIGHYGNLIAALILIVIGIKMILDIFRQDKNPASNSTDPTRGFTLILLSIATSMDALGVGIGFGLTAASLLINCFIIGAVAAIMTFIGIKLTNSVSQALGKRMEVLGGMILIGLAIKIGFL